MSYGSLEIQAETAVRETLKDRCTVELRSGVRGIPEEWNVLAGVGGEKDGRREERGPRRDRHKGERHVKEIEQIEVKNNTESEK